MTRRRFLAFIGLAPVVGPAMFKAATSVRLPGHPLGVTLSHAENRLLAKAALREWMRETIDEGIFTEVEARV